MSEPAPIAFTEKQGFFPAPDNLRLFWRSFIPYRPRGAIALVHGYADHSGRYLEISRFLAGRGLSVHSFDYRGHGQSDGRRGHCDHFSDYLGDLGAFLARLRGELPGLRLFLLAHSHGSLLSLRYALEHPTLEDFGGAVLSAPYLKLAFEPPKLKVFAAKAIGKIVPWLPVKNELSVEMLTHDLEIQQATARDPLYNRTTTPRWFQESTRTQGEVLARAAEYRWPSLVLVGSDDPIASPAATRDFYERAGSPDKKLVVYDGWRHEIMNEVGREKVQAEILRWLDERLT
ncbi:MAG: alpha/beta hydrolase [Deltaproteobacteria bacterium]